MKLNVAKVLANEAREKARIKPLPKVKMAGGKIHAPAKPKQQQSEKEGLLRNLNQEFHTLQKERAVLSSQNWKLVMAEAEAIQKESPELHEAFMNGNVGRPALAAHYEKIREVHEKMTAVWDNIQFVQANGAMPVVAKIQLKVASAPADIQLLQHELNRAAHEEITQHPHQVAAHRAAQATGFQQDEVFIDALDQEVVDGDGPELVHQHHRASHFGLAQQVIEQRGLPCSQEAGEQGDGDGRCRIGHGLRKPRGGRAGTGPGDYSP